MALVFAALVAEIVLQIGELRESNLVSLQCAGSSSMLNGQKGLFQIDADAGYVMRPDVCVRLRSIEYDQVLRTNNRGMVGPDLPATKPAGEFRVVVLGDSYAAGGQVPYDALFPAVLENQLRADGYRDVRVIDAAVGGYTTFNESGLLREDLAVLQPDLVVVAAFLGNDVAENVLATAGGYRDAPEHPDGVTWGPDASRLLSDSQAWFPHNGVNGNVPPPWDPSQPLPQPVGNAPPGTPPLTASGPAPTVGTRVRQFGTDVWAGIRMRSLLLGKLFGTPIDPSVSTAPGAAGPSAVQRPLTVASFEWTILRDPPHTYWLDVAWPLFGRYLSDVRASADAAGAPTMVLVIPEIGQFDEANHARSLSDYRLSESDVDWDRPQRELSAQAQADGVQVLDLLPIFRARSDRDQLYLRLDTHFTALGHQVVGQQLASYLERSGWLR